MAILPPGVRADQFAAALREFESVLGKDWVLTSEEDLNPYRDHFSYIKDQPNELMPSADIAEGNGIAVASLRDIFGMKCATIPQRNEVKDYRDIHALIFQARIGLAEGIAAAMKADLLAAVKSVSLQNLPTVTAAQRIGAGVVQA